MLRLFACSGLVWFGVLVFGVRFRLFVLLWWTNLLWFDLYLDYGGCFLLCMSFDGWC